jgi:hypothetical protein
LGPENATGKGPFVHKLNFLLAALVLQLPLVLPAQTAVEGVVCNAAGEPVSEVKLTLQGSGIEPQTVTTSATGKFIFASVDPGDHTLNLQAEGFYPAGYKFTLRIRQPVFLTIELARKQPEKQTVEVHDTYLMVDLGKTGSSYLFTRHDLDALPQPLTDTTNSLVTNLMPGASDSHDNFLAVRGTEFSLHEFINGVSFLENTQPQFSPGMSPQIFETVDLMTGGFTSEYGNRFGGVLDITTRSGADLGGHGDLDFRGATLQNYDVNADYGGQAGKLGYYLFADAFTSGRYLDPPEPKELYDFGKGSRGTVQFDGRAGDKDTLRLLLMGGGTNFQQPNISEDQQAGRDAQRHLRQQTAILGWMHPFSPGRVLSTSFYERTGSDRVLPTRDPDTPISVASRAPLTLGIKSDLSCSWHEHYLKGGLDMVRLRESESFFFDGRGDPDIFPDFSGSILGGQASAYFQDHFFPSPNITLDLGVRYDYFDLINRNGQVSPRFGIAYHFPRSKSAAHAAYNRYFSPPPIEYSLLASFIGNNAVDPGQRVGNVRPYSQNYFEAGWSQELHPKVSLEVNGYWHTGRNAFENHEISISRIFVPINFDRAKSKGLEIVMKMAQLEKLGVTGRLQYALARTCFYGPITGGFAGDEPLDNGERIVPAFDQTHTGTAQIFYHHHWRGFFAGSAMRYGSGTIVENGPRLPQHFTTDLASGITLLTREPRHLDLEFNVSNVSDSVYRIAKESEEIPIQYAPSRTVGGSLKLHF